MGNNIQETLTRKLGPLPVWIWALAGGLVLYWFRSRANGGTGTGSTGNQVAATQAEAQLVQAEGQASAATLQSPQIIAPGEQVYNPTSGYLSQPTNPDLQNSLIGLIGTLATRQVAPTAPNPATPVTLPVNHTKGKPNSNVRSLPGHKRLPMPTLRARTNARPSRATATHATTHPKPKPKQKAKKR